MLDQYKGGAGPAADPLDLAGAMRQMASFRDGNDILMKKQKEQKEEEAKESSKGIGDFSVSELIARLEAKGKKIAIIEPG